MTIINTVTGPISPDQLGFTLMHEHVMVGSPNLYRTYPDLFGPPNREERAIAALKRAKAAGVDTFVDATTYDLGRDPELLRVVAEGSGVNIINVAGWWLDVPRFLKGVSANQMAREFIKDIREGFRGTNIKAGILKCAADFEGVTVDLEVMARAAARAHIETGVPMMVHSYPTGHVARRQIEIFKEEGVDLTKVKIDHSNDTTDTEYLEWILDQGCYLGLDRYPGRHVSPHMRTVTLKRLIDMGYGDKLCPSHDCMCLHLHKETAEGSIPDQHEFQLRNPDQYLFIHNHVIPELVELGVSEETIQSLFVDNPRRFFGGA
ncbi:MAG: phosphotriesterase-related protein [Chromatiales bacterium]|jgi:phosphotriesterase-related protein|nr:phosphotriesterase-related protein [Chromatiales bacterium]